jgi:hypothetical protein
MTRAVIATDVSLIVSVERSTHPIQESRAARDDLDAALVLVLDVEGAAVRAQPRPVGVGKAVPPNDSGFVATIDLEGEKQLNHPRLVRRGVGGTLDQGVELGVSREDRRTLRPGELVERVRAREQVLHVERCEPDRHACPLETSSRNLLPCHHAVESK